jgi:DNA-directed RNA polymerase subunit RPC12/RpoP
MDTIFVCPDCGAEHDEPAEATLGISVRCLDCHIEIELALELDRRSVPPLAA